MLESSRMRLHHFLLCLTLAMPLSAQLRVINDGFPGENTDELDARLDGALSEFKPEYVVVFTGSNDALNDKKFLPASESGIHLQHMAERIKAQGAQVVMVTVHAPDVARLMQRHRPEVYGDAPPLKRLALVNAQIQRVAKLEHAPLVPFAAVLRDAGGANMELSTDGVHLTARGYGLLAGAVRAKLPAHLPANATILCFGDSLTYGIGVRPPNSVAETPETYPAQLRAMLR